MTSIVEVIQYYQRSIESIQNNLLYCINELYKLPIRVDHLQETGVGKTVNSLQKFNDEIEVAAKTLVTKWKAMVAAEEEHMDTTSQINECETHNDSNGEHGEKTPHVDENDENNNRNNTTQQHEHSKHNTENKTDKDKNRHKNRSISSKHLSSSHGGSSEKSPKQSNEKHKSSYSKDKESHHKGSSSSSHMDNERGKDKSDHKSSRDKLKEQDHERKEERSHESDKEQKLESHDNNHSLSQHKIGSHTSSPTSKREDKNIHSSSKEKERSDKHKSSSKSKEHTKYVRLTQHSKNFKKSEIEVKENLENKYPSTSSTSKSSTKDPNSPECKRRHNYENDTVVLKFTQPKVAKLQKSLKAESLSPQEIAVEQGTYDSFDSSMGVTFNDVLGMLNMPVKKSKKSLKSPSTPASSSSSCKKDTTPQCSSSSSAADEVKGTRLAFNSNSSSSYSTPCTAKVSVKQPDLLASTTKLEHLDAQLALADSMIKLTRNVLNKQEQYETKAELAATPVESAVVLLSSVTPNAPKTKKKVPLMQNTQQSPNSIYLSSQHKSGSHTSNTSSKLEEDKHSHSSSKEKERSEKHKSSTKDKERTKDVSLTQHKNNFQKSEIEVEDNPEHKSSSTSSTSKSSTKDPNSVKRKRRHNSVDLKSPQPQVAKIKKSSKAESLSPQEVAVEAGSYDSFDSSMGVTFDDVLGMLNMPVKKSKNSLKPPSAPASSSSSCKKDTTPHWPTTSSSDFSSCSSVANEVKGTRITFNSNSLSSYSTPCTSKVPVKQPDLLASTTKLEHLDDTQLVLADSMVKLTRNELNKQEQNETKAELVTTPVEPAVVLLSSVTPNATKTNKKIPLMQKTQQSPNSIYSSFQHKSGSYTSNTTSKLEEDKHSHSSSKEKECSEKHKSSSKNKERTKDVSLKQHKNNFQKSEIEVEDNLEHKSSSTSSTSKSSTKDSNSVKQKRRHNSIDLKSPQPQVAKIKKSSKAKSLSPQEVAVKAGAYDSFDSSMGVTFDDVLGMLNMPVKKSKKNH